MPMNVKLIQRWQGIKNLSDSPNCTQTQPSDHWHEQWEWNVFIYPCTFLSISQLADITEHADGDKYI